MNTELPNIEIQVVSEIHRLHQFFVDWFNGILPESEESFSSFLSATAQNFSIIPPSGQLISLSALSSSLYELHHKRPGLQIKVKNVQVQHQIGDYVLATYEEWQLEQGDQEWNGRISTALLSHNESTPSGIMWHHVHETWLPTDD
ncbi:MAG: hypothetical protein AAGD96_23160 [Chloroflexota bacterium]